MKSCFGFMFWGLLLIVLDFKFNGFDILPDALGYALVAIGSGGLASVTGNFITATSVGWLLVVASVVGPYVSGDAAGPFGIFMTVLNCALIWTLLGGVRDIADGRNRTDLAARTAPLRLAYVTVMAAGTTLGWAVPGSGGGVGPVSFVIAIAGLVVMVLILFVMYRAWTELSR